MKNIENLIQNALERLVVLLSLLVCVVQTTTIWRILLFNYVVFLLNSTTAQLSCYCRLIAINWWYLVTMLLLVIYVMLSCYYWFVVNEVCAIVVLFCYCYVVGVVVVTILLLLIKYVLLLCYCHCVANVG